MSDEWLMVNDSLLSFFFCRRRDYVLAFSIISVSFDKFNNVSLFQCFLLHLRVVFLARIKKKKRKENKSSRTNRNTIILRGIFASQPQFLSHHREKIVQSRVCIVLCAKIHDSPISDASFSNECESLEWKMESSCSREQRPFFFPFRSLLVSIIVLLWLQLKLFIWQIAHVCGNVGEKETLGWQSCNALVAARDQEQSNETLYDSTLRDKRRNVGCGSRSPTFNARSLSARTGFPWTSVWRLDGAKLSSHPFHTSVDNLWKSKKRKKNVQIIHILYSLIKQVNRYLRKKWIIEKPRMKIISKDTRVYRYHMLEIPDIRYILLNSMAQEWCKNDATQNIVENRGGKKNLRCHDWISGRRVWDAFNLRTIFFENSDESTLQSLLNSNYKFSSFVSSIFQSLRSSFPIKFQISSISIIDYKLFYKSYSKLSFKKYYITRDRTNEQVFVQKNFLDPLFTFVSN